MGKSRLQQVADIVGQLLQAAELPLVCAVERLYDPKVDLKELPVPTSPLLTVIGRKDSRSRHARALLADEYTVDVGIRAQVASDAPEHCDPLSELTDAIADALWTKIVRFTDENGPGEHVDAYLTAADVSTPWSVTHLREQQVWLSVVTFTFASDDREIRGAT